MAKDKESPSKLDREESFEASSFYERGPSTVEEQENRMISYAIDLAERQLREGTASSQVIVHYLKLATSRERLEKQKLKRECEMLEQKALALQSTQRSEELFTEAMKAMRSYHGDE